MNTREFLKGIFSNPEGTEEYIIENRSHMKSLYMCLITGFLMVWNTLILQFVGETYIFFAINLAMYFSFYAAGWVALKFLPEKLKANNKVKLLVIGLEIAAIAYGFYSLVLVLNLSFLIFLIIALGACLFGELYLAFKETFFDFYWLAYRKTEYANKEIRGEISRIVSWYILITGLIFQAIFFPFATLFMDWHQRGVGMLIYGFLMLLWWVWSAALCTYILDKKIKDNHFKNSLVAWSSTLLGIGHLIVWGQLILIILQ